MATYELIGLDISIGWLIGCKTYNEIERIKMYAQLNIGRNINGKPMDQKQWELFVSSAKIALAMSAIKVDHIDQNAQDKRIISLIMVHFGQGKYFNESGTLENEDSVYISLFWDQGIDFEELEKFARGLERVFEQELVAIVK